MGRDLRRAESQRLPPDLLFQGEDRDDRPSQWERFYSWHEAKRWAKKYGIAIDDVGHRIVQVEFSDSEMALYDDFNK